MALTASAVMRASPSPNISNATMWPSRASTGLVVQRATLATDVIRPSVAPAISRPPSQTAHQSSDVRSVGRLAICDVSLFMKQRAPYVDVPGYRAEKKLGAL